MADEFDSRVNCAVYAQETNKLRDRQRTPENLTDEQIHERALLAVDHAVYGWDAKRDKHGNWIEQGIGAKGRESGNHFAAIKRWQGEEAYQTAVREIWRRDPVHAKKLGLPQPARA
jgi:hypothetical protein